MASEIEHSIVFIMDKSGSMVNMGDEPWQSLNSFVNEQLETNIKFNFTLVFFSTESNFKYKSVTSSEFKPLCKEDFVPDGMTALYDAIGDGINYQLEKNKENVIFVILTDGLENSSRKYNKKKIKTMISDVEEKHKWKFIYLGANQDSYEVGHSMGIKSSEDYEYTTTGLRNVMRSVSHRVSEVMKCSSPK